MFVYTLKKAVVKGYLDVQYLTVAERGWEGIKGMVSHTARGEIVVRDSVEGMGVQRDYANYVNKKRVDNLPHGMAAVMLAASVMED